MSLSIPPNPYREQILKAWRDYDAFLAGLSKTPQRQLFARFGRNLYAAQAELGFLTLEGRATAGGRWVRRLRLILRCLITAPVLYARASKLILCTNAEKEAFVAKHLGLPMVNVRFRISIHPQNLKTILIWGRLSLRMFFSSVLNKDYVTRVIDALLTGIHQYQRIDLTGVRLILTMRDRYPQEIGVLEKAKREGVKTVKYSYFPIYNAITNQAVSTDYYFCSNPIEKSIFSGQPHNENVSFHIGGIPYWDSYAAYRHQPDPAPRLILFMSNYGDANLYGSAKYIPAYYIEEIAAIMPGDCILGIKVHPLDDEKKYARFLGRRVQILRTQSLLENAGLYARASFVLAVASLSVFEAKHINTHSYLINYHCELFYENGFYDRIRPVMDVIESREDLTAFLSGEKEPIARETFLKGFNPAFPNSTAALGEYIESL